MRRLRLFHAGILLVALVSSAVRAQARRLPDELAPPAAVESVHSTAQSGSFSITMADTLWVAQWNFDSAGACDAMGWQAIDFYERNDGSNEWHVEGDFDGVGGIMGQAAVLSKHDLCWVYPDGYGNDWDYAIVCRYTGAGATLSFEYLLDSETDYDSLTVEADALCNSNAAVPPATPASVRQLLFGASGLDLSGSIAGLALPDFGAPSDTHCVYIRFHSDNTYSPADGGWPTTLGAALVVDDITVTGGLSYAEDFEGALGAQVTLVNSAPSTPFGVWARLFPHPTDNDICSENASCAWIFSDSTLPAYSSDMAFGPDGAVVRNWLDNMIFSPWVSLPTSTFASDAILQFREFPGNDYETGRIVRHWTWRGRQRVDNTDTPALGDSVDCVSSWAAASTWSSLTNFRWRTRTYDSSHNSTGFDPSWEEVQIRFRVTDWQLVAGASPPSPLDPGPGPYIDSVRFGLRTLSGPAVGWEHDFGDQGQDTFATDLVLMSGYENYVPSTDRFGTGDFSRSSETLTGNAFGYWTKRSDSVFVRVEDLRGAGGVTDVGWHGAIVEGPHVGKAPPPWNVGANGFFSVEPDTVRRSDGSVFENYWFVDLDDDYFRGGDVLLYFWSATDAAGGYSSYPEGLVAPPASLAQAEAATGGLVEVSYLPKIDWDPAYLTRIAADPHGKLEPTPQELADSQQSTCILYDQWVDLKRRRAHRTSFMYTLDRLGYAGLYDVYDHQGEAVIYNNHLAGRATVEQATGYSLIVYDTGNLDYHALPLGGGRETFYPQTQWFQDYLAQAPMSEAGRATLWILGANVLEYNASNPLLSTEMGLTLVSDNQSSGLTPSVEGQTGFTWADGDSTDFSTDLFYLDAEPVCGGVLRDNDGLGATGTAVVTHRYGAFGGVSEGAIVMNADAATSWNTIMMSFWWEDARPAPGPPDSPTRDLAAAILTGVLPESCQAVPDPATDMPLQPGLDDLPRVTMLHANTPNPFNPTTTIRFDLAREAHVQLRIYDVTGRLVHELVNGPLERKRHVVVWDGLNAAGLRVPSGVYFYRLRAADYEATRKMVVLR